MSFDLSFFPKVGKMIFDFGVKVYTMLDFNFGDFTINGWVLLVSIAIFCVVVWLVRRILE